MKQHPIDLLPENVRVRNRSGMLVGRYITVSLLSIAVVVVMGITTRLEMNHTHTALQRLQKQADFVLSTEQKSSDLRSRLAEINQQIDTYWQMAHPLEISRLLATVVNHLPESVSLDRLDISAMSKHRGHGGRGPIYRGPSPKDEKPPRFMYTELAGIAASDVDIAELVAGLENVAAFEDVSLDFSRTRTVRGKTAREFRLSFRVDFDRKYVVYPDQQSASGTSDEVVHVQQ